jgi:hypothetical protein
MKKKFFCLLHNVKVNFNLFINFFFSKWAELLPFTFIRTTIELEGEWIIYVGFEVDS